MDTQTRNLFPLFIPVKVISKKFRGKFLDLLKQASDNGEIASIFSLAKCNNPRIEFRGKRLSNN